MIFFLKKSSLRNFQERYIFLPLIFCPQAFFLWNSKLKHSYKKYSVNAWRNLHLNQVYYSQAISHHPCISDSRNLLPVVHLHLLFLMAVRCLSRFHARDLFPQISACPLLWDASITIPSPCPRSLAYCAPLEPHTTSSKQAVWLII